MTHVSPSFSQRVAGLIAGAAAVSGCTFNFDVTSQRTSLENQVMGSYRELEDDLILVSSVRGGKTAAAAVPPEKRRALDARQDQEFNRDDVDELKDKEILGETATGQLALLPPGVGQATAATPADVRLARTLVEEENADRAEVWRRIIAANQNLSDKDLPEVRKTYAKLQQDKAQQGQWLQDPSGAWRRLPGAESLK